MYKNITKTIILTLFFSIVANANGDININNKLSLAKQENKHLIFFFHIPHCPYCKRMLEKNFQNEEILSEVKNNFILIDLYTANKNMIKLNSFKGTIKEFAKHIGAIAYPATVFMNNSGKVVHKAIGYRNTDEHIAEISYISSKSYKNKSLEDYIQEWEFNKDD